jgi:hypothetical protein
MQFRSPKTVLVMSAVVALSVSALAPTAAFAMGPCSGAGSCDGSSDPVQQQARALDGSAQQVQARAGGGRMANANGRTANGRNADGGGANAVENQGAGRGPAEDGSRGAGNCEDCDIEMGSVTPVQIEDLVFMANEEKMAHDVYVAFAELYDVPTFERVAESESIHQLAVDTVLERYGIENSTTDLPVGEFSNDDIAALYDQLIEQGSASLDEALAASVLIEQTDVADLAERMAGIEESAPDVFAMYAHLQTASEHHRAAFERQL